jgi:hypothetical protein
MDYLANLTEAKKQEKEQEEESSNNKKRSKSSKTFADKINDLE